MGVETKNMEDITQLSKWKIPDDENLKVIWSALELAASFLSWQASVLHASSLIGNSNMKLNMH